MDDVGRQEGGEEGGEGVGVKDGIDGIDGVDVVKTGWVGGVCLYGGGGGVRFAVLCLNWSWMDVVTQELRREGGGGGGRRSGAADRLGGGCRVRRDVGDGRGGGRCARPGADVG